MEIFCMKCFMKILNEKQSITTRLLLFPSEKEYISVLSPITPLVHFADDWLMKSSHKARRQRQSTET